MNFNLSIVLDRNYENREDLYTTASLEELDDYLKQFNDHHEIRNLYRDQIQEFLLDNKEYIKMTEEKNNRLNNGRICITFLDHHKIMRSIAIIYKNDGNLLPKKNCLRKIIEELKNDDILKELYLRKKYLLTRNEIDLLRNYFLFPVSYRKYKDIMIKSFVGRIKYYPEERSYLYLRSLMNICGLQEKKEKEKLPFEPTADFLVLEEEVKQESFLSNNDNAETRMENRCKRLEKRY